jgi:hydrogenase-4 component B
MNLSDLLLFLGLAAFALGGTLGLAGRSRSAASAAFLVAALGCALTAVQSALTLLGGGAPSVDLSIPGTTVPSPLLSLVIAEDPLSAFFLLVVSVSGGAVLLASVGYADQYVHARHGALAGCCALFVLSMVLVCCAGTVFLFLVAWEAMTLLSYFLVVHEHEVPENRKAGLVYVIMSHAAAAAIIVSMLLLAVGTGQFQWAAIAQATPLLSPWVRDAAFLAALAGFGTKAGMVPLHVWLPDAHPAAPSNVSALMSGVMIKMGILGLLRVVLDLLGGGPSWWAYTVLGLGALSALVGVLYAIAQHDLKRLLAYHSIENIGIILMGIGASLAFLDLGYPALAALAMAAALLHTWNHALFKALLFLGAGAAVGGAGTRDLERLGGLIRRMPGVALGFLIGALAISALPPFNGFVSEWLLFQSFFAAFSTGSVGTEMLFSALAAVLALTSGLAAYCFVKAFGITFLARARSPEAEEAPAAPRSLVGGMGILASLCLLLGVAPILALDLLGRALTELTGSSLGAGSSLGLGSSVPGPSGASLPFAPGILALVLAIGVGVAWVAWRVRGLPRVTPRPSWDCGLDAPTSRMEYTASGYAQPVEQVFQEFYRPHEHVEMRPVARPGWGGLARIRAFRTEIAEPVWDWFYAPLEAGTLFLARKVSRLQSGRIHAYLAYMFVTLVVLLLLIRIAWGATP